jgi:hypothetical protein
MAALLEVPETGTEKHLGEGLIERNAIGVAIILVKRGAQFIS